MKLNIITLLVLFTLLSTTSWSQGPPITSDKPIMLGGKSVIVKTLTEIRDTNKGTYTYVPAMFHYLPTSNSLVAIHLPYVNYSIKNALQSSGSGLGDISILGKYQFYRKDKTARTFRMVLKTLQTIPTGENLGIDGISTGTYQSYFGVVAGYESLKYGISNEIGYNLSANDNFEELRYKFGVGLPLLKPTYPVNQLNLYFEYTNLYKPQLERYSLLFAQGIQYARKQFTWEVAVQLPLIQNNVPDIDKVNYSIFLGTRYVF